MLHRKGDGVLSHDGLTSRCMGRDENAGSLFKPMYRSLLENIHFKWVNDGSVSYRVPLIEIFHALVVNDGPHLILLILLLFIKDFVDVKLTHLACLTLNVHLRDQ